jgi:hypothetical protein
MGVSLLGMAGVLASWMYKLITLFQDPRELGRTSGTIAGTKTVGN